MEPETIDRRTLVAYLLGELPESEREAIAELTFTNDELFDELQEVENDLIGQYVRGRLTAKERSLFESYLQVLPDGRDRIAVAQALANVSPAQRAAAEAELFNHARSRPAPQPAPAQTAGWGRKLTSWIAQPAPALAMATGLIAIGGLLAWQIFRNNQMSDDHSQLIAQMRGENERDQQSRQEAERNLAEERARAAQLQTELTHEKQLRETQPAAPSPAVSGPISPWSLSSKTTRALGQPPESVKLNPKARVIELAVAVKGREKYTGYEVELITADDRQILWKDNQPFTPPVQRGENIIFYRPAKEFEAKLYKLTLTLFSAKGRKELDCYFTVVK